MAKNTPIIITVIIVIAVLILGLMLFSKEDISDKRTVSSTGISTIKTMPDMAAVYLRIDTLEKTADLSKDKNAELSEKVNNALLKYVESKDLETLNYNIYEEFDWSEGNQKSKGWKTSNSLKVNIKDFKVIGKVVDAVVEAGATNIDSINFELSEDKRAELKKQVLEKASKDSREKAEAIARGLSAKLGKLVSVTASDYDYRPYPIYAMAESAVFDVATVKRSVVDIKPQELEVTANVQAAFEIG